MGAIVYMLQVSACLGVFYGFYYLALSRLTFFTINRWYLVITLILGFVIPLLTITVHPDSAPLIKEAVYVNQFQTFQTQKPITTATQVVAHVINWLDVLKAVYLLAVAGLFLKLIVMLISFFANIKSKKSTKIGNIHILHGDKKLNNGSFLNYIFLNDDELSADEIQQIIEHEMLHVKLLHSVDRILVKIAQIVLWFNPFVYLYTRAIEENHEFEVDREIGLSNDKTKYADMLLHLSVARQGMLYNSFSMVPLKKRIAMLFTKPTNHMKKVIYLLVLPVVMLSCLAFARFKKDVPTEKYSVIAGVELSDNIIKVLIDGKSYDNDVLYTISGSCIKAVRVKPLDPQKIVNGKWVDVTVIIQTKNGEIVYMTETEKENLVKERHARSTTGFYSRVQLTDNDGKPFDKAIINTLTGSVDVTVKPEDKIGFVVDGVFYNENDIRFIDPKKSHAITVNCDISVRNVKPGEYAKGFSSIFTITTIPVVNKKAPAGPAIVSTTNLVTPQVDTIKKKSKPVLSKIKAEKPKPVATTKPVVRSQKAFLLARPAIDMRISIDEPFVERSRIVKSGEKVRDKVTFHLSDGSASAYMGPDDKLGAFIDGVFYDEKALQELPMTKARTLTITHEGFDAKKIPDGPYAVPFAFKTKTAPEPAVKPTDGKVGKVNQPVGVKIDSINKHNIMIGQEVLQRSHYPQFYDRLKFTATDGKDYDYVVCTIGKGMVTIPVKFNAKTGLLIDGVFFNEDAVKKLPADKTKALEMWPDGLDAKKIPKGYVAALSLRTKKATTDN
jgi:hypothetical protein